MRMEFVYITYMYVCARFIAAGHSRICAARVSRKRKISSCIIIRARKRKARGEFIYAHVENSAAVPMPQVRRPCEISDKGQ